MQARHLKKGMLVKASPGHVLVIRDFEYKIAGIEKGELGFTVMRKNRGLFLRMATSLPKDNILDENAPIMYCDSQQFVQRGKSFTKHVFLAGSDLIYLHANSCRGLEPVQT